MTLENLLYNIGNTAIKNKVINYAAAGSSIFELNAETIVDYPLLFASPTGNHEVRVNTTDYEITLYYIDRLLRDSANDVQIFSTGVEQLKLIMRMIENIDGVIEVADTYSISNFAETEKMNDSVAGAFATVTITVLNVSECDTDLDNSENSSYDKGYQKGFKDGKIEGVEEYKESLPILNITENGTYDTINKGVTVNVQSSPSTIFIKDTLLKLGNSTFETIPEYIDFEGCTDMSNMFDTCSNLISVDGIDTSSCTNMYQTFYACRNLETVKNIDTSKVEDMSFAFQTCTKMTVSPFLDTTRCTKMTGMFSSCLNLVQAVTYNTVGVTDMYSMFDGCYNLKQIGNYNTMSVKNMSRMFDSCSSLTTIPPMNTIKVENVELMFNNCYNITSLPALDFSSVKSITSVFGGTMNQLTDVGGFINLKCNWMTLYELNALSPQSVKNILNGLYDFTGNGEMPASGQGQLKVDVNFIAKADGEDFSNAIDKGWTITY